MQQQVSIIVPASRKCKKQKNILSTSVHILICKADVNNITQKNIKSIAMTPTTKVTMKIWHAILIV